MPPNCGASGAVDETFADSIVCAGLIDQHLHRFLARPPSLPRSSPSKTGYFRTRPIRARSPPRTIFSDLCAAEHELSDPGGETFSWGYHRLWHGPSTGPARQCQHHPIPIVVWQRSCHGGSLNSAAITQRWGSATEMADQRAASSMVDLVAGRWWESG